MHIETIRVTTPVSDDNPLGFVTINKSDFKHGEHEPFGDDVAPELAGDAAPTMAELIAARDRLVQRAADLDAQEDRNNQRAADLDAQAAALREQAAALAAQADVTGMTKEQLQAALTAKGIPYPAAANKADLQALLNA